MKTTYGRRRTGPHKRDVTGTNPKKQTPERSTQHSKQPTHEHGMICGMRYAMHMHDLTRDEWTWPQLENPNVPLERRGEIAWKRYKERRNRSYGLEMASNSNMATFCNLQQVAIYMQWDEQATAPKHDNKIHGRDLLMMLNKRLAVSYGQFIH